MDLKDSKMCNICCEDFSSNFFIPCPKCNFEACKSCVKKFLLGLKSENPRCMNESCKFEWSLNFVSDNTDKIFFNKTYRDYRAKFILERERMLIPSTQTDAKKYQDIEKTNAELRGRIKKRQDSINILIEKFNNEIEKLIVINLQRCSSATDPVEKKTIMENEDSLEILAHYRGIDRRLVPYFCTACQHPFRFKKNLVCSKCCQKFCTFCFNVSHDKRTEKCSEKFLSLLEEQKSIDENIGDIQSQINSLKTKNILTLRKFGNTETIFEEYGEEERKEEAKEKVLGKCCKGNCDGFIVVSKNEKDKKEARCAMCDEKYCIKCHEKEEKTHVCDPNILESIKTLKKETKPCPKCYSLIFKIDGCDQIWCTKPDCHTAFSWNTGKLETGKVHNPHYYEWMRKNGGVSSRPSRRTSSERGCQCV